MKHFEIEFLLNFRGMFDYTERAVFEWFKNWNRRFFDAVGWFGCFQRALNHLLIGFRACNDAAGECLEIALVKHEINQFAV